MILAIESSCDESAIALLDPGKGFCGEWVHTQIDIHREYGGVVPDLATREHLNNFPPLITLAKEALGVKKPDSIAVTQGPGLAGCLAMGISTAKALASWYEVPLYPVNHLRAHALSPFISLFEKDPEHFQKKFANCFPHLGMLVSGGNTILFEINDKLEISILAETVDDAAGEAIDKGAKLLGLPYPGGPEMEKIAEGGIAEKYDFPRAFQNPSDHKFSFSGLKTSLRYTLEKITDVDLAKEIPDICASYQRAVVDQITRKIRHILKDRTFRSLGLSGGVANNSLLRSEIEKLGSKYNLPVFLAKKSHTGDNAGMVAFAAMIDQNSATADETLSMSFNPSWRLA